MEKQEYKTIEVTIGNYKKTMQIRPNYIATIVIDERVFNIIGSHHTFKRMEERQISKYDIVSSIVGLGNKLHTHNNSGKHIIIENERSDTSTVFTVEKWTVVLITVLDRGEMSVSPNVEKETIREFYAG